MRESRALYARLFSHAARRRTRSLKHQLRHVLVLSLVERHWQAWALSRTIRLRQPYSAHYSTFRNRIRSNEPGIRVLRRREKYILATPFGGSSQRRQRVGMPYTKHSLSSLGTALQLQTRLPILLSMSSWSVPSFVFLVSITAPPASRPPPTGLGPKRQEQVSYFHCAE